jgi:hypothetical protein
MTAALNALKGKLKLDPKLSTIAKEGKKDNKGGKQKKNRKSTNFNCEQKRDKTWKKEPPKKATIKRRKWENTLTIGASTTCHGPSARLLTSALGSSTKRSRRRISRRPVLPLLQLLPPCPSILTSPPSWPPWLT